MHSIAPSAIEQMTPLYVFVDEYLKAHPGQAQWRHSPNAAPAFTEAEVLTIGPLQGVFEGVFGCATLKKTYQKKTYQMVASKWRSAFPRLCSYGPWVARLHALPAPGSFSFHL